ncbi:hypothetical protein CONLIGDRAFT_675530 [Coniochaeta ligniaria NRRL 30616]|uniref:Uncharacterized protein n=1 Tax=Coniochaeta ligniaria NRRL 30616 TaxID=1408157 RepID=A0A1J7J5B4_9PEZI|nr:hypothetical protein CONLIGDRAFT_675530 [Coniochaeta ligniaria NRRL 30616]
MASYNSHPLPTPPGQGQSQQGFPQNPPPQRYPQQYQQQQQPQPPQQQHQDQQQNRPDQQQKPRPRSRGFSFRSDKSHKSHKSSGSKDQHQKIDLHETAAEKESHRLHTKADPSVAINEAEPAAVQANAKTLLAPLRGIQHKDALGNPIADPDRSNPTRSRWERPLDTIRSFEAAIDGGYNRKSYLRSGGTMLPVPPAGMGNLEDGVRANSSFLDSESVVNVNPRRNSYYGTNSGPNGSGGRFPHDSYYGGRPQSTLRLEEQPGHYPRPSGGPPRDSYFNEGQQGGYNNGYSPGPNNPARQRYPRTASEPQFNSYRQQADPNVYPIPNNHRSYETVASASGSGTSGEQAGYQTDLTSDNSSAERVQAVQRQKREPTNDYGIGFSQNPAIPATSFNVGVNGSNVNTNSPLANGGQSYGPPPVPTKDAGKGTLLRKGTNQSADKTDKRKSWFAKKFSKNT